MSAVPSYLPPWVSRKVTVRGPGSVAFTEKAKKGFSLMDCEVSNCAISRPRYVEHAVDEVVVLVDRLAVLALDDLHRVDDEHPHPDDVAGLDAGGDPDPDASDVGHGGTRSAAAAADGDLHFALGDQ